jgi:hypothetical protein
MGSRGFKSGIRDFTARPPSDRLRVQPLVLERTFEATAPRPRRPTANGLTLKEPNGFSGLQIRDKGFHSEATK